MSSNINTTKIFTSLIEISIKFPITMNILTQLGVIDMELIPFLNTQAPGFNEYLGKKLSIAYAKAGAKKLIDRSDFNEFTKLIKNMDENIKTALTLLSTITKSRITKKVTPKIETPVNNKLTPIPDCYKVKIPAYDPINLQGIKLSLSDAEAAQLITQLKEMKSSEAFNKLDKLLAKEQLLKTSAVPVESVKPVEVKVVEPIPVKPMNRMEDILSKSDPTFVKKMDVIVNILLADKSGEVNYSRYVKLVDDIIKSSVNLCMPTRVDIEYYIETKASSVPKEDKPKDRLADIHSRAHRELIANMKEVVKKLSNIAVLNNGYVPIQRENQIIDSMIKVCKVTGIPLLDRDDIDYYITEKVSHILGSPIGRPTLKPKPKLQEYDYSEDEDSDPEVLEYASDYEPMY